MLDVDRIIDLVNDPDFDPPEISDQQADAIVSLLQTPSRG